MSASMSVLGLRTKEDPTYKKNLKVLIACVEAGVKKLPEEVAEYFDSEYAEMCLAEEVLTMKLPLNKWRDKYYGGYELKVSEIPEGVETIRFYIS